MKNLYKISENIKYLKISISFILLLIVLSSCASNQSYLSTNEKIADNVFGAYIDYYAYVNLPSDVNYIKSKINSTDYLTYYTPYTKDCFRQIALPHNQEDKDLKIKYLELIKYSGELISADSNYIYVLCSTINENSKIRYIKDFKLFKITRHQKDRFKLVYADQDDRYWILVGILPPLTIVHGFALIFTFFPNLITTLVNAGSASSDYQLDNRHLDQTELYKYSRFPQGLPNGINLDSIRPNYKFKYQSDSLNLRFNGFK